MERKNWAHLLVCPVLGLSAGNIVRHAVATGSIADWIIAAIVMVTAVLYIATDDK